jgi:hypothetical protein
MDRLRPVAAGAVFSAIDQGAPLVLSPPPLRPTELTLDELVLLHHRWLADWRDWRTGRGLPDYPPSWWVAVTLR